MFKQWDGLPYKEYCFILIDLSILIYMYMYFENNNLVVQGYFYHQIYPQVVGEFCSTKFVFIIKNKHNKLLY